MKKLRLGAAMAVASIAMIGAAPALAQDDKAKGAFSEKTILIIGAVGAALTAFYEVIKGEDKPDSP